MIADIYEKENILSTDRFMKHSLAFTRAKTGAGSFGKIVILYITLKSGVVFIKVINGLTKLYKILVDTIRQQ